MAGGIKRPAGRRSAGSGPNDNGGRCRHRPPLVPALTAVAGWRGHLSLGSFGTAARPKPSPLSLGPGAEADAPVRAPVGLGRGFQSPSPIPVGSLLRDRDPAFAPLAEPAGRSLTVSLGSHRGRSLSGPPSKSAGPKPSRSSGMLSKPKPLQIRSGRAWGRSLAPFPTGSGLGAIPAALAGVAGPRVSRGTPSDLPGGFSKSRLASALADSGAASSASPLPPRVPASLGERQRLRPWRRAFRPAFRFRSAGLPATT